MPQEMSVGARRVAYQPMGPQHRADDPTPGTYQPRKPAQPATAAMGFGLTNLRRRGDYAVGEVTWDPDRVATMSAGNIEQAVITYVKAATTHKGRIDLGNIGRVRVVMLDLHAGMAEVMFRTSEARVLPPEQIPTGEGVDFHE